MNVIASPAFTEAEAGVSVPSGAAPRRCGRRGEGQGREDGDGEAHGGSLSVDEREKRLAGK
ncbi:hypothetical protein GCM10020219_045090 [Nonomuraea dietziae]